MRYEGKKYIHLVVVTTAYPDDAIRTRALNAGITGYLTNHSAKRNCSTAST
jgi:DNA-binding NarL/FixJ family response regulator